MSLTEPPNLSHPSGLNEKQKEAVFYNDGPLMVLAGAGSGKTRMLTTRVIHLIKEKAVNPDAILAMTFTNKAAAEMKERISKGLIGVMLPSFPQVSTFHSFCARFLRKHYESANLRADFTIYDDKDQLSLVKKIMESLGISTKMVSPKSFQWRINNLKNQGYSILKASAEAFGSDQNQQVITLYEKELEKNNAIDFAGLIHKTYETLKGDTALRDFYRKKFEYIHVDEYQDTNRAQYLLLKEFCPDHENQISKSGRICVVGDEDQSIYAWRGADIGNILDFERDFPETRVVKLEQNYRSTSNIIEAATAVIKNNSARKDKTLWTDNSEGDTIDYWVFEDDRKEADGVVKDIVSRLHVGNTAPSDIAIFYRTNAQSRHFEDILRKSGIPYQIVGGVRFYERKEIKDLLAYLKVIINPSDDISFMRIVNTPARGIGKTTINKLISYANEKGLSLYWAIDNAVKSGTSGIANASLKKLQNFYDLMQTLMEANQKTLLGNPKPIDIFYKVIDETGYVQALQKESSIEAQSRIENIGEFEQAIKDYEKEMKENANLSDYLSRVTLRADTDDFDSVGGKVSLMTVHSSKGLEFPNVYVVGLEEGLFPSMHGWDEDPDEMEEERRLFYVAMTRAMKHLTLTNAKCRRTYGNFMFNDPARFLFEMPQNLLQYRDFSEGAYGSAFSKNTTGRSASSYGGSNSGFGSAGINSASSEANRSNSSSSYSIDEYAQDEPMDDIVEYDLDDTGMDQAANFRKGSRIKHPVYGIGVIRKREGSGEATKVHVEFRDRSTRKFILKFANLSLV